MNLNVKNHIIQNGIKNLKEFGYPNVTAENIFAVEIYRAFFEEMLKENIGKGYDEEINAILSDIRAKENK